MVHCPRPALARRPALLALLGSLLGLLGPLAACKPAPDRAEEARPAEQRAAPDTGEAAAPVVGLAYGVQEYVREQGDTTTPVFRHASTDLDMDGRADAIVLLQGSRWCEPRGCTMLVFRGDDEGALLISSSAPVAEPIRVSSGRTAGWRDLIVRWSGKGDVLLRFDGTGYASDPSRQPAATPAQAAAAQPLTLSSAEPEPAQP